jgi:squalene-associated FAD-dependent desaturase
VKIAIIGAGWAGLAAAVQATQDGHHTTVFEASRSLGGRARALNSTLPDGTPVTLDNGQHILIGAYQDTLALMRQLGVDPERALLRMPMTLRFPDGQGLCFPAGPAPLDALAGLLGARGWRWHDRWSLLRHAAGWRLRGFRCDEHLSVSQLCQTLSPRVMQTLIEPLCVSALNTPTSRASASVFLRVLQDALFGVSGGSNLLLPRLDLSELMPQAAARWLATRGGQIRLGARVQSVQPQGTQWQVDGEAFDTVVLATSASEALHILTNTSLTAPEPVAQQINPWCQLTRGLQFEAITTVYVWAPGTHLPHPMLTLRSDSAAQQPAQFVFDRGQLGGPPGLLAFVVSASQGDKDQLQTQVLAQARQQLGLGPAGAAVNKKKAGALLQLRQVGQVGQAVQAMQVVQTVVEKRATFACTPGLQRPATLIAPGLLACGDYVQGPYPATLEGAVRSGQQAARLL